MALAEQLKFYRESKDLSQTEVAQKLHVSRQSISKWENGHSYPDIDNIILLSNLYQVSIDELLQENKDLKQQIKKNLDEIQDKKRKLSFISKKINQHKDDGLILLLLAGLSSFIFPLGLILSSFVLYQNKKTNSFYKLIYFISVFALFINIYDGYAYIATLMDLGTTTIEQIE